ncbi:MAG: DUF1015 domain-containing protein [Pirellulales bacterium]|nr:DUF1015 domain-containing protein [Pirellulales bacterium]
MPEIQAFRAIRYNLGHVGSLSDVTAPPYDVIDPTLQEALYKRHPANVVRLILNRDEPGDDEHNNRYTRAARFFRNWQKEGLLATDPVAAIYVYHQHFTWEGRELVRRGVMARCRLERFGEGTIYPHEETMASPKQDRLLLTRACKANLSQVFGLYPDADCEIQRRLDAAVAGRPPVEAVDHLGVVHRMWPVTDVEAITAVAARLGPLPLFIADGHHRYETACTYRDELAAAGPLPPAHPANYVLMMLVSMHDSGLLVLPTHRLFSGLPPLDSRELAARLGDAFATRIAGEGADLAHTVWEEIELEASQGTLAFFTLADERWLVARLTEAGRARMAAAAPDHSPAWRDLGVALLHRLVIDTLLAPNGLPTPKYVHRVEEVVESLETGDYHLACLVMPATVDHIRTISQGGERLPAKSTYFFPKLLSGLVFNPLV